MPSITTREKVNELSRKKTEWLENELNSPEMQRSILSVLKEGLSAVKFQWDGKKQQADEVVDFPTRLKSCELALAYAIGRPLERQQIMVAHQQIKDPSELVKGSPALKEALRELLDEKDEIQTIKAQNVKEVTTQ
jgi:hypothetical protein